MMKGKIIMTNDVKIEFVLEYKNNEKNHPILNVKMPEVTDINLVSDEIINLDIDFTSDETENLEKLFKEITLLSLNNYSVKLDLSNNGIENEYYKNIAEKFVNKIKEELNKIREKDEYKECQQLMDDYIKFNGEN